MKKMTSVAVSAALAVTAVAVVAGTASADPAPASAPAKPSTSTAPAPSTDDSTPGSKLNVGIFPGVTYTSDLSDRSVQVTSPFGTITEQGSHMLVQDQSGHPVYGQPFAVTPKAVQPGFPAVTAPAPAAKPAPGTKPAPGAKPAPANQATAKTISAPLHDIDWTADFNSDLGVAATQFGLATGLGGMIGGITGVVLGCPIGAATGGLLFAAEAAAGGLGLLAGCLTGAATLGTLGPVIGGAILGVPVGIASAVQMYNTMHAAHEVAAQVTLSGR